MFYFLAPLKGETSEVKEFDVFLLISLSGADWWGPGVCGVTGGDWGTPREHGGHLSVSVGQSPVVWQGLVCMCHMLKPCVVEGVP